jgi:hypothetical protein
MGTCEKPNASFVISQFRPLSSPRSVPKAPIFDIVIPRIDSLLEELEVAVRNRNACIVIPSIHNVNFYKLYAIVITLVNSRASQLTVLFIQHHCADCTSCETLASSRVKLHDQLCKKGIDSRIVNYEKATNRSPLWATRKKFSKELEVLPSMLRNSIFSYFGTSTLQSDSITSLPLRYYREFRDLVAQFYFALRVMGENEKQCRGKQSMRGFDFCISLNGRYPFQSGIRTYCEVNSIQYLSLEHGQRHGLNLHLANFQPQQIRELDKWIERRIHSFTSENLEHIRKQGIAWLTSQENDTNQNVFLKTKRTQISSVSSSPRLLLCTSSLDERFNNLGVDLNGWESQYAAYDSVIRKCIESGVEVTLKVHPNSLNKAWKDLWRLYSNMAKWETLQIEGPWSNSNVFELIDQYEYFVSWGSSLMISAAFREKKGFLLGPTNFMSTLKVPVFGPDEIAKLKLSELKKLERSNAELAAGVIRNWGYNIESLSTLAEGDLLESLYKVIQQSKHVNKSALQMWRDRVVRRVEYTKAVTKGKYMTPNELENFLTQVLQIPRRLATFAVKSLFLKVFNVTRKTSFGPGKVQIFSKE